MQRVVYSCPYTFIARSSRLLMTESVQAGPVQATIEQKLNESMKPQYLKVINESYKHAVPKGSETHFNIIVVSEKFESMPLLQRHRLINSILEHELQTGVHALSIQARTVVQWKESGGKIQATPPCNFKK
ncbi:PREDICTED: bolA-like protein 1 [Amphimedon queenslandica]|uniref:BolA n=1 Tax=Amphimedon queenslandica TaxID=400682 RepID=A0A1X7V5H4_AMPQE|nr:PREDICTED: bolA-like protein 1 [Amphimedon queenslandica]|eukprot:XP_011403178.1 PREDICTED: bolA-like protein 1 [Amphimedon queenslandica]